MWSLCGPSVISTASPGTGQAARTGLSSNPTATAVANITRDDAPAGLSQASGASSASLALVVNLRAAGDPDELHGVWLSALDRWMVAWKLEIVEGTGSVPHSQCFRPTPPTPPRQKKATDPAQTRDGND